jgi:hypothetical protein
MRLLGAAVERSHLEEINAVIFHPRPQLETLQQTQES